MQTQKWSASVLDNLKTTVDHTKVVVKNLALLSTERSSFATQHQLVPDVVSPTCDEERDYLVLVAFVHDVHKLLDGREHASRGADFVERSETVDLIRFHDVLGVANTGEASPLFLADLVAATRKYASPSDFLRRLLILTTVDVGAAGFLTQERLESYEYFLGLVQEAGKCDEARLSELALNETGERIRRLLQSNDRIEVENGRVIDAALERHTYGGKLRKALSLVRFHYGAWALEPWFWCKLGQQEPKPNDAQKKNKIVVDDAKNTADLLDQFLDMLWRIVNSKDSKEISRTLTTVGGKDLSLYNLEALSVKFGIGSKGYDKFLDWCS